MAQRATERVGQVVDVLIEESLGQRRYGGRAGHQAPEVDGTTEVLSSRRLAVGDMVRAVVTGAEGADLQAEVTGDPGRPGTQPASARGAERIEPA
jgi:ribosomal protein S12 methylthiotransferase